MSALQRGLIVSLTPAPQSPWQRPDDIARLAAAVAEGGAVAVKVDGPDAIRAVKALMPSLTVLAVNIDDTIGAANRITPTVDHARALVDAGADIVELEADAAKRRLDGQDIAAMIAAFVALGKPVKAGVGLVQDAVTAVAAGAAYVSSSTSGYTPEVAAMKLPDIQLVRALVGAVGVPVVAERGYASPDHIRSALDAGARAVVVGSAIVDPVWLTRRMLRAASSAGRSKGRPRKRSAPPS
jgi:N-acylglucosamine-6-phosphate 2-epimerase